LEEGKRGRCYVERTQVRPDSKGIVELFGDCGSCEIPWLKYYAIIMGTRLSGDLQESRTTYIASHIDILWISTNSHRGVG
jgi:hypothetical protein